MPVKIFTKIFPGWTGGNYIDVQSNIVPPVYLLDIFPGATLGYSVRKLRDAYTGYAFEVRRSSDNATTNIGFIGEDLDAATLTTFLGGFKGYITKWYNQAASPLSNSDMVQPTGLLQPLIDLVGGQYYVLWDGSISTGTKMNTLAVGGLKAINVNGSFSTFAMAIPVLDNQTQVLFQQDQSTTRIGQFTRFNNNATTESIAFGTTGITAIDSGPSYTANTKYIHTAIRPTTSLEMFLNGVSNGSTPVTGGRYSSTTMGQAYVGSRVVGESFYGYNGEILLYPSDMSADRIAIENNIQAYYGI